MHVFLLSHYDCHTSPIKFTLTFLLSSSSTKKQCTKQFVKWSQIILLIIILNNILHKTVIRMSTLGDKKVKSKSLLRQTVNYVKNRAI